MIVGPISSGAAVGDSGQATATGTGGNRVTGLVKGIYLKYVGSPPAGTTDVTVKTKGAYGPSYTVLKISNAATDGLFVVAKKAVDPTGAEIDTWFDHVPVDDVIQVVIEGANADDSVEATLFVH